MSRLHDVRALCTSMQGSLLLIIVQKENGRKKTEKAGFFPLCQGDEGELQRSCLQLLPEPS